MTTDELVVDVSQDWVLACDVQRRLMEVLERAHGAVDYGAWCRQMQALGGDCYDCMPLIDNRLLMVIGDASGKGLPAALMIASVQSSLRTAVFFAEDNLPALLNAVNGQACASSFVDRCATLFCGAFDGATRMLRYINAGHNPPMIIRRDHSVVWLDRQDHRWECLPIGTLRKTLSKCVPAIYLSPTRMELIFERTPDG